MKFGLCELSRDICLGIYLGVDLLSLPPTLFEKSEAWIIVEELGERKCLGDINASIIRAWELRRFESQESVNWPLVTAFLLNKELLDDVGENWSVKSCDA